ncbi:MAG: hypothetical protein E7283_06010 [Lachnospiraceae bacterium]|nr:hypothetical protein [Lachnospiraceae bacterium]
MKKILSIILAVLMIMPSLASVSQAADKIVLEDIVVGINEHYIGAGYEDKIATAFEKYMANAGYTCKIEYRTLGNSSTTAAQLGSLINSAGDIDIVIGAGANIETTAGVEIIVKALHKSTYNSDGKRYGALLTDKTAAGLFYYFLTGNCNHSYSSLSDKTCDFCGGARAVSKLESIVVGVNEHYIGAGYEDKIATAFETYMDSIGYSCNIEYRTLGNSSTTAAQLGSLINSADDIDIVIGAGANIDTTAGVDIIKKELHKSTYNSDGKRYAALLTGKTAAGLLYNFLTGGANERQEVVVGVNVRRIGNGYVDKIKADFEEYMAEMGLEISVVFRDLGNSTTTAAQLGSLVKSAGDIDVLLAAGNNVDSSTGSALSIYEKDYHVPHYNSDGSRYAARLTNTEAANIFYDFVTGGCKMSPNRSKTKTLNILFIGNSFTYYNDMPDVYFANICKEGGYKVNVTRITKGSHFLYKFADPTDTYGAKVKTALENNQYDIVIIQEQSSGTITNPERFKKSVRTLAAMVKENGAELYLYSTWGYNEGYSKLADCGGTTAAMEKKVRTAYESIAKEVGAKVVYAGVAMLDIYKNTSINVYASDLYHPSENGSLLVAYTFYATLFGEDPRALTYTAGLSENDVVKLRKAAFEAAFYTP